MEINNQSRWKNNGTDIGTGLNIFISIVDFYLNPTNMM